MLLLKSLIWLACAGANTLSYLKSPCVVVQRRTLTILHQPTLLPGDFSLVSNFLFLPYYRKFTKTFWLFELTFIWLFPGNTQSSLLIAFIQVYPANSMSDTGNVEVKTRSLFLPTIFWNEWNTQTREYWILSLKFYHKHPWVNENYFNVKGSVVLGIKEKQCNTHYLL